MYPTGVPEVIGNLSDLSRSRQNNVTSHISEIALQSFFFTLEIDFLEKRLNFSGLCSLKIVSKDGN
jgi:hypothetical protein